MARLAIFKETSVPGSMIPHAMYVIAPEDAPGFVEIYVTDASATARRVIDEARVLELIAGTVAAANAVQVVANLAARNALSPEENIVVMVLDATADPTVGSGGATYVWQDSTSSWHKIAEHESMDLTLTWAALADKPSSSVADLDDAVTKRHTHANIASLAKIGENVGGNLTYDGELPATAWASTNW